MKKIIFLDFDGVLHCDLDASFSKLPLVEKYLQKMPDVEIVISSAWRETLNLEELRNIFSTEFRHRVLGVTPMLKEGYDAGGRQREIEIYLKNNNLDENNASWIAIDDIEELFDNGYKNLIVTNYLTGFTEKDGEFLLKWYKGAIILDKLQEVRAKK